jgi:hypothetical protein
VFSFFSFFLQELRYIGFGVTCSSTTPRTQDKEMTMNRLLCLGIALVQFSRTLGAVNTPGHHPVFTAPAGTLYCQIQPDGVSTIPNGRLLTPRGRQIVVEPHPYGLTLSNSGHTAVTVNRTENSLRLGS